MAPEPVHVVEDGSPTEWKKYSEYSVVVDPDQDDKATEIKLCSFARPHMRAFHCSWWAFFIAFFIWFAVAPLLSEIRDDIGITKQDVWTSNIIGVGGTILMRFVCTYRNESAILSSVVVNNPVSYTS
eukprot:scaffold34913_cov172-Amphora_coffeaeformis.AAC.4